MRTTTKIPMTEVCKRLSKVLKAPIGMNHLAVLMHGWTKKHPDEAPPFSTLSMRKKKDGYAWLKPQELQFFGHYAGYDLSEK